MPLPLRRLARRWCGAALAAAMAAGVVGCAGSTGEGAGATLQVVEDVRGGTLTTFTLGPVRTWDPQRIASRGDAAFAARVFSRSLTAYQHGPDPAAQVTLTGDLATDVGTSDASLRVWSFTLRDGVKWQDGSVLDCEDVKYGISRAFATEEITGGPNYAVAYLDIPKTPTGASVYLGPYAEGEQAQTGQAAFDKAVVCDGPELTIRLSEPVADFPGMVSTPSFAAYKADQDKGAAGTYAVFSAGPYTLSGAWTPERGGTFVRNPHWSTAGDPIRLALPDQIVHREGLEPQEAAQLVIADEESAAAAITLDTAPPAMQQQIAAAEPLTERSVNALNGIVDYLVPNFKSPVMANTQIRTAFALSTDRNAYRTALGGPTAAQEATSILSDGVRSALPDSQEPLDPTGTGDPGETTATDAGAEAADASGEGSSSPAQSPTSEQDLARELLAAGAEEAGVATPVPVRVAYRSSPTMDTAMRSLEAGWTDAGFAVELQPIPEDYFATISSATRAAETDVFWSNWAADWNSASTVLPPLFDSRLNISETGSGRNYGYFVDANVDAAMTAAMQIADRAQRLEAWLDIDTMLRSRGAYIALVERRSMFVAGSDVTNLTTHPVLGGILDLAVIGVGS